MNLMENFQTVFLTICPVNEILSVKYYFVLLFYKITLVEAKLNLYPKKQVTAD